MQRWECVGQRGVLVQRGLLRQRRDLFIVQTMLSKCLIVWVLFSWKCCRQCCVHMRGRVLGKRDFLHALQDLHCRQHFYNFALYFWQH